MASVRQKKEIRKHIEEIRTLTKKVIRKERETKNK